jgi:hypothetical protein
MHFRSVVACCVLSLVSGCGAQPRRDVQDHDPFAQVHGAYLGQRPPGFTPEVFAPGLISTERREGGVVAYPGGEELYSWVVEGSREDVRTTIYVTKQRNGHWTSPEPLPFSGTYVDGYPALHPDGSRLYFQSNRPIDASESAYTWNIWFVEREGDGWGQPRSIGRPINGRNHTSGPSVTADGTLYFTIMELGGVQEIYRSRLVDGAYQEPERLPDAINARRQQFDSYVAPDESYLIFGAVEGAGHQAGGLFIAFRDPDGRWSNARSMGPAINGDGEVGPATITPDGKYLFFAREDPAGQSGTDVYWVDAKVVKDASHGF